MKYCTKILVTLPLFISSCLHAEVHVIVHPSNANQPSIGEISRIFLGKQGAFADGIPVKPLNYNSDLPAKIDFFERVLKKQDAQYKAHWAKLVFTGAGTPPDELDSEMQVVEEVKNNPSAIGFVSAGNIDGVKVIGTF